jgi:signal transduction histidine kinase
MKNVLHDLIRARDEEIVARARAKAALRSQLSCDGNDDSIRFLLRQLCEVQLSPARRALMVDAARAHGGRLAGVGSSVFEVVHRYGDVCQAVMDLALELDLQIAADEFRAFNRLLDDAIAGAVVGYEVQREATIVRDAAERVATLAVAFQNGLFTAIAASDVLTSTGTAGNGVMEVLLYQSLQRLQMLVDQPLESRTGTRVLDRQRISLPGLIREATLGASMDASRRGVAFVEPLPDALAFVLADRKLLAGTIAKIVRHALRMTSRGGRVAIKVCECPGRVSIDVETECAQRPSEEVELPGNSHEHYGREHRDLVRRLWPITSAVGAELTLHDAAKRGYIFSLALQTALTADGLPTGRVLRA